ncbi:SH3 domain-containing protein [Aquabacterium sp.]|uniref:SH3 domain-containing protein n=1 Tax=Aquabacterium sp. TaxID=1872578 RepID=UPI0025C6213A|nr:SH3 domain-containing protein [Aquabacterium sp.]
MMATFLRSGAVVLAVTVGLLGATGARAADEVVAASVPASAPAQVPLPASAPVATPAPAPAPSPATERLQVSDPYIELRTGPGRGFPVFFVVARAEWIEIELRHTDWFRVRTAGGKMGWVSRQQLETTLTASGATKSFRDILIDDYLSRRVQLGAAWGRFNAEPMLKIWTSYRLSETLSLEGTVGQVQGKFAGADFWHLSLLTEPWSDQRFSPFASIGMGKYKYVPNASLVGATTTRSKLANATAGVNYHLSDRFLVRADYSLHTVFFSDTHTNEFRAWTLGMAFFF